jgi:hypothetical protein
MLTQARLKEVLRYDPDSGEFFWLISLSSRRPIGSKAGGMSRYGYIGIDGVRYYAHRLAWLYVYGELPKCIDHINQNKSDNRIVNLREADKIQNGGNSKARKSRSGLKGAHWHRKAGRWTATVWHEGKCIYLGLFDTPEEAHAAYCKTAEELYGEFFSSEIPGNPEASAV